MTPNKAPEPYWNPYIAGIGIGLVLLTTYIVMGHGIGATGAFTSFVAYGVQQVAPTHAETSSFYSAYLPSTRHPLADWLVFEILGVIVGGFFSGRLAGRVTKTVEKGPRISVSGRMMFAFFGGIAMGIGSRLARGCTSGQALTGGALLSVGSWVFIIAVFLTAYAIATLVRRQWT